MSLDIVDLIEKNPISKLSQNYNNKLINKIKEKFTNYEQKLFVSSFYCYLNYDKNDFIIDLDDIWKFMEFNQKYNAIRLLEKLFKENIDYKKIDNILHLPKEEQKKGSGGHNKIKIFMTIKTFKSFCLKAQTKKTDEIHEYYLNMEELIQEFINEESNELKQQLEDKNKILEDTQKILEVKNKEIKVLPQIEKQKILLKQFALSRSLVYICKVKTYENGSYIIKVLSSLARAGLSFWADSALLAAVSSLLAAVSLIVAIRTA